MKLLYVIDSLHQGGAERSLVDLLPHYALAGVETTVLTLKPNGVFTEEARNTGATVIELEPPSRVGAVRAVAGEIGRRSPDLVHTTLFEANIAGRFASAVRRVPVVSSLVNTPYGDDQFVGGMRSARLRAAQALDMASARLVRRFHANTADVADVMAARLRVGRGKFDIVPRGRNDAALGRRTPERRGAVRAALGFDDATPILITIARHEPQKNLATAVRVLTEVREHRPGAVLLVAGREGRQTTELQRTMAEVGVADAVQLLGHRADVADLLAAGDVFLFPSRREGFPGVVIEAMALEIPIVASDLPGVREALGERAGDLPDPDDVPAMTKLVLDALDRPDDGVVTARRRRFEERFTIASTAEQMLRFYERALGRPVRPVRAS